MKYCDLLGTLEEIAPREWFEEEDNSGIQVHDGKEEVARVLVCLEVNDAVIEEAVEKKADMIITHHPLLFHPLKRVDPADPVGRYVMKAIQNGIDIYSSHLAFDTAAMGNNMYLAGLLQLQDVAVMDDWEEALETACPAFAKGVQKAANADALAEEHEVVPLVSFMGNRTSLRYQINDAEDAFEYDIDEVGSIGYLPKPMNFDEFQIYVERCLNLPQGYVRCVDGGREIRKVGFCTGAGGDFIYLAAGQGCDAYITGDLKLHEAQYAKAVGLTVIDAGHYGTEKIFTENMAAQLRAKAGQALEVLEAEANTNPYTL